MYFYVCVKKINASIIIGSQAGVDPTILTNRLAINKTTFCLPLIDTIIISLSMINKVKASRFVELSRAFYYETLEAFHLYNICVTFVPYITLEVFRQRAFPGFRGVELLQVGLKIKKSTYGKL